MPRHLDGQLNLPPTEVRRPEDEDRAVRNSEQATEAFRETEGDGYALAALLFDQALRDPRCALTNKEIAYLLKVSDSLVLKWRTPGAHVCPSYAQMLRLPIRFHLALHRAQNAHFGFGRSALLDLLEAVGSLALVVPK